MGECRRAAQRLAKSHDFNETLVGRIGIVATELTNNVVKHAGRGEFLIQAIEDGCSVSIELVTIDGGPGMMVEKCMRDGYSTAGTAGTGLGAVSRLSTLFDVYSAPDQGTVAVSRVAKQNSAGAIRNAKPRAAPEFGAISVALAGEIECGDMWRLANHGGSTAILVVDGLGHGPLAATASKAAVATFSQHPFDAPSAIMQHLHRALSGSRGAAAACAVVNGQQAKVIYAGIGNIAGSIVSPERSRGMVSHNGIVGVQMLRQQQFEYACSAQDRIVMHSDGMSARWVIGAYPGLFLRHAAVIAGVLYRDYARPKDDVTIVVSGIGRE